MYEKKDSFCFASDNTDIVVPKKGNKEVEIQNAGPAIVSMGLPEVVKDVEGIATPNGTVVYPSQIKDVTVTVQALQEKIEGVSFDSVRSMITIKNENAPMAYDFDFTLPKGYTLVEDYDYDEDDCGQVFMLDKNGEIVNTIDPPWAKDANDIDVETYYEISGSTLTQVVKFNENTDFPVVADPTSHPAKSSVYYLTKDEVKTVRDKYTQMTVNDLYSASKYNTWNNIYIKFSKKYAKIKVSFRWRNGGKNSGYILNGTECTYVSGY